MPVLTAPADRVADVAGTRARGSGLRIRRALAAAVRDGLRRSPSSGAPSRGRRFPKSGFRPLGRVVGGAAARRDPSRGRVLPAPQRCCLSPLLGALRSGSPRRSSFIAARMSDTLRLTGASNRFGSIAARAGCRCRHGPGSTRGAAGGMESLQGAWRTGGPVARATRGGSAGRALPVRELGCGLPVTAAEQPAARLDR
jgi:hypothetical protein